MNPKRRSTRTETKTLTFATLPLGTTRLVTPSPLLRTTTPDRTSRFSAPPETAVTYYNCQKPGHYSTSYPEPRKTDLNALKEEILDDEILKEEP